MSPEHRAAIVRAFVAIVIADLRRSGVLPMPAGEDLKEEGDVDRRSRSQAARLAGRERPHMKE